MTVTAKATAEEHFTARPLRGYVSDALARSKDDPAQARALLVEWAADDEQLRGMLLKVGADQIIRTHFTSMRRSASSANEARVVTLSPEAVSGRASARIATREFWDKYTLYGTRPLRTATRAELQVSVSNRREQARGSLSRANFEERVANRLKDDVTQVQQSWKIDQLIKLATKCEVAM